MDLGPSGRTAIVTGGSRGIGRACVELPTSSTSTKLSENVGAALSVRLLIARSVWPTLRLRFSGD